MRPHLSRDVCGVRLENGDLSTSRIVFWQAADLLEEPGAARIVKELARDRLVGPAEPAEHSIAETLFARRQVIKGKTPTIDHSTSSASRNPAKAQRAEGGKKLR